MSSNLRIPKICAHCGERFIAQKTSTRFCSHKCSRRAYKDRLKHELAISVNIGKIEQYLSSAKKLQKSSPTSFETYNDSVLRILVKALTLSMISLPIENFIWAIFTI